LYMVQIRDVPGRKRLVHMLQLHHRPVCRTVRVGILCRVPCRQVRRNGRHDFVRKLSNTDIRLPYGC